MFKYVVHLTIVLCLSSTFIACSDKAQSPPRPKQVNPTSVKSEGKKIKKTIANNLPSELTGDEISEYKQELSNLSPEELIDAARFDVSDMEISVKAIAAHLANHEMEDAEREAANLLKKMKNNNILLNVITLRILADEFSVEQVHKIGDIRLEMQDILKRAQVINEVAIKLTSEHETSE